MKKLHWYLIAAAILVLMVAFAVTYDTAYKKGYRANECPPADTWTADSLQWVATMLEYKLQDVQDEKAHIRERLDSALNATPKQTPKQRADYAFRSSYGMPVGALVDSLLADPTE